MRSEAWRTLGELLEEEQGVLPVVGQLGPLEDVLQLELAHVLELVLEVGRTERGPLRIDHCARTTRIRSTQWLGDTHTHTGNAISALSKGARHIRLVSSHCLPSSFRLMTADCGRAGPNGGIPSLHEGDQGPTMISANHRTAPLRRSGEPHFREMATL